MENKQKKSQLFNNKAYVLSLIYRNACQFDSGLACPQGTKFMLEDWQESFTFISLPAVLTLPPAS